MEKFIKSKFTNVHRKNPKFDSFQISSNETNQTDSFTSSPKLEFNPCDMFGSITFEGYDNLSSDQHPNFMRFYSPKTNTPHKEAYELINKLWQYPSPNLVISVLGGLKNQLFKNSQLERNFKRNLCEIMKTNTTWIIGSGLDVGVSKIVGETIGAYRQGSRGQNQACLIGVSSCGVVKNIEKLISNNCTYPRASEFSNGTFNLNEFYDCYLFCDDGSTNLCQNDKEFLVDFEKYLQNILGVPVIRIMLGGERCELETIHMSLMENLPLILIKNSGGLSDFFSEIFEQEKINIKDVEKLRTLFEMNDDELVKYQKIAFEIFSQCKNLVTIKQIVRKDLILYKSVFDVIISRNKDHDMIAKLFDLSIRFNCPNVVETRIFQSPNFSQLKPEHLKKNLLGILSRNQIKFLELFFMFNIEITELITKENLETLYMISLESKDCPYGDLLNDLIISKNKTFGFQNKTSGNLLDETYKIVQFLSENILKSSLTDKSIKNQVSLNLAVTYQDLFLWALLTGHTEMSLIFWRKCKDNVGLAMVGAIIKNKMKNLILYKGQTVISNQLVESSKKFEELAIAVIQEANERSQRNTRCILTRPLETLNNMSCLQIAVTGNLLHFLNHSACRSYAKEHWMGDLSPFFPMWKILLTILFSPFLLPVFVIFSLIYKSENNSNSADKFINGNSFSTNKEVFKISFASNFYKNNENKRFCNISNGLIKTKYYEVITKKALEAFYKAPVVKFIIYLISYVVFLLAFIYLNLVELKPIEQVKRYQNMTMEFFVYIYILGFIVKEVKQINNNGKLETFYRFKAGISGTWNVYDFSTILVSIICVVVRFSVPQEFFIFARCLFGLTFCLYCLRTMQFYFISPSIGPKVIMIKKMIVDIFFFLCIFLLFIVSYGTLFNSLQNPNGEFGFSLVANIFYRPFFQTFGELMLDEFQDSVCKTTSCIIQYRTVIFGFAIFLLLTNVLLLNLLIAMFGSTFNEIQNESEKIFSSIQIQLVEEFHQKPMVPPPFNLIYYFLKKIWNTRNRIFKKSNTRKSSIFIKYLADCEKMQILAFERISMEILFDQTEEQ